MKSPTTEELFILFLKGNNLRTISKMTNIPRSTLSYRFSKHYGKNYSSLKTKNGVRTILKEYLEGNLLNLNHKKSLREWICHNDELILKHDLENRDNILFTNKQLDSLTYSECSRSDKDWKYIFENVLIQAA
ncbi:hypothetical protein AWQ22_14000 [Picosynechococcus sp. PCC 7117]|nr:hypothetical protein AWQ22_14000 [Picosynechococcus sp. PCC 7117]